MIRESEKDPCALAWNSLGDLSILENDIVLFSFGYFDSDINGDGNVDLLDFPIIENNVGSFIFSEHP